MSITALLSAALPALFPAVSDGVRGIFARVTHGKGAAPQNVNEQVQLMKAETERVTALAALDVTPPNVHAWVADIRALQRPALATWILVAYITAMMIDAPPSTVDKLGDYAAMVVFYLFGSVGYQSMRHGAR